MNFNFKNKKGLTLIELMVSVVIFSLISGAIASIFVSSIQSQQKILRDQKVISEISYVMEYVSRTLRMTVRDEDSSCLAFSGHNYQLINSYQIRFLNHNNKCHEFLLSDGIIYERKSEDENYDSSAPAIALTSNKTHVEGLRFEDAGSGWHSTSGNQPKVMMNFVFRSVQESEENEISIQTTVSQRNINVP